MPRSPLDEAVASIEAEIARLERKLSLLREAQRLDIEATEEEQKGLHEPESTNRVPIMQAPNSIVRHSRRGRPLEATHPFPVALQRRGLTVTAWAKSHGYDRSRVKSWFAEGSGARSIPRDIADSIEKELGVPATIRTWKNGIA